MGSRTERRQGKPTGDSHDAPRRETKRSALRECGKIFWGFLKLGFLTIGGGYAMIPQMQQVAVEEHHWLTEEEVVDCIGVSQSLPGVIAINMACYIGNKLRGTAGAIAACLGVVTPSFVIISLAVLVLDNLQGNRWVEGAFTGVKAAVCGLIVVSAIRLGRQVLHSVLQWILMLAALTAVGFLGISAVWVILAAVVLGILLACIANKPPAAGGEDAAQGREEAD